LCALSLALTALSYLLIALILSLDAPIFFYWLEPTVVAVGYSAIGAIIASRLPKKEIVLGIVRQFSDQLPRSLLCQAKRRDGPKHLARGPGEGGK